MLTELLNQSGFRIGRKSGAMNLPYGVNIAGLFRTGYHSSSVYLAYRMI